MDKKKALEILNLNESYTNDEIIKRYDILTKKFKNIKTDKRGFSYKDISTAYNVLMGYEYYDKDVVEKRKKWDEHPNKLLKMMGTNEQKVQNFFYFYKWHLIAVIIGIALAAFFVVSMVGRKTIDFTIDCFGSIIYNIDESADKIEQFVINNIDEVRGVDTQFIFINEDIQYDQQMRIMAETAGNDVDIFIVDRQFFDQYAKRGLFQPVDKLAHELKIKDSRNTTSIVEKDREGQIISEQPAQLYGFTVTDNTKLKEFGIYGQDIIMCIGIRTKDISKAESFIRAILAY